MAREKELKEDLKRAMELSLLECGKKSKLDHNSDDLPIVSGSSQEGYSDGKRKEHRGITGSDGIYELERVEKGKEISGFSSLTEKDASQLFEMMFGKDVEKSVIDNWCDQGIRFSFDPETSFGLVQHQGGPCGVLAAIQAFLLKYLFFYTDELDARMLVISSQDSGSMKSLQGKCVTSDDFDSVTEDQKRRALVRSMLEILFTCGSKEKAVIATLSAFSDLNDNGCEDGTEDERISKLLEGVETKSASDLQLVLRVKTYTEQITAFHQLKEMIPVFRSRMGAFLFLVSALLSRGLDSVHTDGDEKNLPLITCPSGHTSQEIVNLMLCGEAVSNVVDDKAEDIGGGEHLKGIRTNVEVGFLTVLESLSLYKVHQHLKHPRWPIWIIGSQTHYTVLFALDETLGVVKHGKIKEVFDLYHYNGLAKGVRNESKLPISTDDQSLLLKQDKIQKEDKMKKLSDVDDGSWMAKQIRNNNKLRTTTGDQSLLQQQSRVKESELMKALFYSYDRSEQGILNREQFNNFIRETKLKFPPKEIMRQMPIDQYIEWDRFWGFFSEFYDENLGGWKKITANLLDFEMKLTKQVWNESKSATTTTTTTTTRTTKTTTTGDQCLLQLQPGKVKKSELMKALFYSYDLSEQGILNQEQFNKFIRETKLKFPPEEIMRHMPIDQYIEWDRFWRFFTEFYDDNLGGWKKFTANLLDFELKLTKQVWNESKSATTKTKTTGDHCVLPKPRLSKLRVSTSLDSVDGSLQRGPMKEVIVMPSMLREDPREQNGNAIELTQLNPSENVTTGQMTQLNPSEIAADMPQMVLNPCPVRCEKSPLLYCIHTLWPQAVVVLEIHLV